MTDLTEFLVPTSFIDSDHPDVQRFAQKTAGNAQTDLDKAVRLYYAVRDEIRYNAYSTEMNREGMRASTTLKNGDAFCIPKAILLAAVCRAQGIPARLAFADVRNHLTSDRLKANMNGSTVFVYHGQTEIYLESKWVKCTPAFNLQLCEKIGIYPLEFDGREDSVFHPFDKAGNQHMEYLNDHGSYADMPYEEFYNAMLKEYGHDYQNLDSIKDLDADDFEAEAYAG